MTAKESKAVAVTCAESVAGEIGYVCFSKPVPLDTELTLVSALRYAEAELEWLRSRVRELSDRMAADFQDDELTLAWCNASGYWGRELKLLASDGGADGDNEELK